MIWKSQRKSHFFAVLANACWLWCCAAVGCLLLVVCWFFVACLLLVCSLFVGCRLFVGCLLFAVVCCWLLWVVVTVVPLFIVFSPSFRSVLSTVSAFHWLNKTRSLPFCQAMVAWCSQSWNPRNFAIKNHRNSRKRPSSSCYLH